MSSLYSDYWLLTSGYYPRFLYLISPADFQHEFELTSAVVIVHELIEVISLPFETSADNEVVRALRNDHVKAGAEKEALHDFGGVEIVGVVERNIARLQVSAVVDISLDGRLSPDTTYVSTS